MTLAARYEVALSISNNECIDYWDVNTGAILETIELKTKVPGTEFNFLDDSHLFSFCYKKPGIEIYSLKQRTYKMRCTVPEELTALCISSDHKYIAAGSKSGKIYIWLLNSGYLLRVFRAHYKSISCIKFTNDLSMLLTASEDSLLRTWLLYDIFSSFPNIPKPFISFAQHSLKITDLIIGVGNINALIISCSIDRTIKFWDLINKQLLRSIELNSYLTCIKLSSDESYLVIGSGTGVIYKLNLLELDVTTSMIELKKHNCEISSLDISFNDHLLISSDINGQCYVWDMYNNELLQTKSKKRQNCQAITFIQDTLGLMNSNMKYGLKKRQLNHFITSNNIVEQKRSFVSLQQKQINNLPQVINIIPSNRLYNKNSSLTINQTIKKKKKIYKKNKKKKRERRRIFGFTTSLKRNKCF